MVMLQLSGVGLHKLPVRLIEAARDISSNGPYWKIAKKYGVSDVTICNIVSTRTWSHV